MYATESQRPVVHLTSPELQEFVELIESMTNKKQSRIKS